MLNMIALLKELVACQSLTPYDAGCQEVLIRHLKHWDFRVTQLPFNDAENFWATPHTNPNPRFVFAGHTDVVPVGNLVEWQFDPFQATEHQGLVYGRGVADMKGALAAMMAAFEQFAHDFPVQSTEVGFLITSAEEGPSQWGTPIVLDYLQEKRTQFDWCVVGEPSCETQLGDVIKNGRRGSLTGRLIVEGKQGHIAYPHLALNPIHASAPFLQSFLSCKWDVGNADFQPTQLQISNIHAGTGAGNVIPGQLELLFNFRYSPEVNAAELMQKTEDELKKHNLSYQIEWTHFGEPFLTKPEKLTQSLCFAIEEIAGIKPQLSTSGGTSDARYIAKTGAQVVEFGLCNQNIHQVNESIALKDINQLKNIYYRLLVKLLVC
ncbi:MAG: succinyl-diaminopimelate desuccinylase [Legionellales bacterium]|nr:succinyl-diaminopimelate desuccinylase [Legionellales bacterium]